MSNPLFTPENLRAALLGVVNHIMDHYDAGLFSEGDALGRVLASVCVLQDEVYYREERAREEENIRLKKAFAEWSLAE